MSRASLQFTCVNMNSTCDHMNSHVIMTRVRTCGRMCENFVQQYGGGGYSYFLLEFQEIQQFILAVNAATTFPAKVPCIPKVRLSVLPVVTSSKVVVATVVGIEIRLAKEANRCTIN